MNAFVKKEVRLLLPSFLIGCLFAFSNWLLPIQVAGVDGLFFLVPFVLCPGLVATMSLNVFGGEMSSGTFSNLLAQPISRVKIWQTKIILQAASLLIVGFIWCASFVLQWKFFGNKTDFYNLLDGLLVAFVFGLVVFSGGLWTVLLLRQVAAAFWFTLLVPGMLLVVVIGLFAGEPDEFIRAMNVSVLGGYSLAGFFFARWLFFRAQDVAWAGGAIVMPELRGLSGWLAGTRQQRVFRPRAALWRKEFQLHQSQLVMAFALLALHLGVLAVRNFSNLNNSPELKFALDYFWALWMVMPLLVGCAAVAEERKLGTLESQLCLPAKRWLQFGIKFFVVLFLSVLLGAVMPLLLEGSRILPNINGEFLPMEGLNGMPSSQVVVVALISNFTAALPVLMLAGIAVLIGAAAFYASSLARNTLQSLAPAVWIILLLTFLLAAAGMPWGRAFDFLWHGPLAYFIAVPLALLTLLALAFWNFQQVRISQRIGWRNLLIFLLALVLGVATTSAVYHRAWEKLMTLDSAHGPARLSPVNPARLNVWRAEASVRLSDGRIWTARFAPYLTHRSRLEAMLGNVKVALEDAKNFPGSNWVNVQRYGGELIGVKTDGTLWISEEPMTESKSHQVSRQVQEQKMRNLVQFGDETNWVGAHPTYLSALLVKSDGTLWKLGTNRFDEKHQTWPGLRAFTPHRLVLDSDWAKANEDYFQFTIQKTNGSIWVSLNGYSYSNGLTSVEIEPEFSVVQLYDGNHGKFRSTTQINNGWRHMVGIREDGTFRVWADTHLNVARRSYDWGVTDLQIGNSTNWVALAGGDENVVTLKNDGTLWLWDFRNRNYRGWSQDRQEQEMLETDPIQLGSCSDWISISGNSDSLVALAADGSLWWWPLQNSPAYYENLNDRSISYSLLGISRKPQRIANIFDDPIQPANAKAAAPPARTLAVLRSNPMPMPRHAPIAASLLNISNALDGSRIAWYCLSNHSAKGVVFLGDSNSLPYYTLLEYMSLDDNGVILATNHNLMNFADVRQATLPAHTATTFPVLIPSGVTNANLYLNYLRQKNDDGLMHDIKSFIGWQESATGTSEPYENFPLPPWFVGLKP